MAALGSSQRIHTQTKAGQATLKRVGTALSDRFVHDDKGWRIFVSVEACPVEQVSLKEQGALGVDANADHLAVSETDRFGNLIDARRIDLITYGKTLDPSKAIIGDAAVSIPAQAQSASKPLVIEALNFQKNKAELETAAPKPAESVWPDVPF